MTYMGSKARIAKHILPIMLEEAEKHGITTWIEPFVGGGNMIDKVPNTFERVGYDLDGHVIQAMLDIRDNPESLLDSFSAEDREFWKKTRNNNIILRLKSMLQNYFKTNQKIIKTMYSDW